MRKKIYIFTTVLILLAFSLFSEKYKNHDLTIKLEPAKHFIEVNDKIDVSNNFKGKKIHFLLHGNLSILFHSKNVKITEKKGEIRSKFFGINTSEFKISDKIPIKHYSVEFLNSESSFSLKYSGVINHPLKMSGAEYSRGFSETPGIICEKGVYLSGSSFWVPWFDDNLVTYKMKVNLIPGWSSVSQGKKFEFTSGKGSLVSGWDSREPMDEIYLIAAKFAKYKEKINGVNIFAFLRNPDKNLAEKYIKTTGQYMTMYEKLIGKYPYSKFALIENFWETGYGMASFTLLGPKIIRFPFILHSSYPHELLHNWWGNSVFVDYKKGNWCEGITVFMADHLIKEQRGQGAEYRRDTIKAFKDYVNSENEFPVYKFRARYDSASSAIGYGKVMMMFNMLRLKLGDKVFLNSIRDFYRVNKFKKATFEDIRRAFENISGKDLKRFFNQWVYRKGTPFLKLEKVKVKKSGKEFNISFSISQNGVKKPYQYDIPVYIYVKGEKSVRRRVVKLNGLKGSFGFHLKNEPLKIAIDPMFDIFRILSDKEIPSTFSKIFGSKKITIILPNDTSEKITSYYKDLADIWFKESRGKIEIVYDSDIKKIPSDRSVWIFGWNNSFKKVVNELVQKHNGSFNKEYLKLFKKKFSKNSNSLVLSFKNPANTKFSINFLSTDMKEAIPGLARKLPHYGKYSYLAFSGDEPSINFKGQWNISDSPLVKVLSKGNISGYKIPKRRALGYLEPLFSKKNMKENLEFLASLKLKGRGLGTPELDIAADYIRDRFKQYGLIPGGDNGSYFQKWMEKVSKFPKKKELKNVIGIIKGTNEKLKDQAVVVSAHYDHLGLGWPDVRKGNEGKIHPGADDNASGISLILELARTLGKSYSPERTIIFVAFTGEENGLMGSRHFVKFYKNIPVKNILADLNIDTVGRLNEKKPMIIGGTSAKEWKFIFMGIGFTTGVETDLVMQDLDASDQVSFIRAGIPAIQIFSGPHTDYHKPTDTVDKIDYKGMVKIASISKEAIVYLAERKQFLTFTGKRSGMSEKKSKTSDKSKDSVKPSIGIMPDFSFNGKGVKVAMVITKNGIGDNLAKGDIITDFNGVAIKDLRSYTTELYKYKPGEMIKLKVLRRGNISIIKIKLRSR